MAESDGEGEACVPWAPYQTVPWPPSGWSAQLWDPAFPSGSVHPSFLPEIEKFT